MLPAAQGLGPELAADGDQDQHQGNIGQQLQFLQGLRRDGIRQPEQVGERRSGQQADDQIAGHPRHVHACGQAAADKRTDQDNSQRCQYGQGVKGHPHSIA